MPEPGPADRGVAIAVVGRRRGKRGEVVLRPHFDLRQEELEGAEAALRLPNGEHRAVRIEHLWWHGERLICRFEGCAGIDDARRLLGAELFVAAGLLAPLAEGEYYVADLVGCAAETVGGERLGEVTEVIEAAGAAVLRVVGERESLVPLARSIVVEVDLARGRLLVDPPPGLLDINEN